MHAASTAVDRWVRNGWHAQLCGDSRRELVSSFTVTVKECGFPVLGEDLGCDVSLPFSGFVFASDNTYVEDLH